MSRIQNSQQIYTHFELDDDNSHESKPIIFDSIESHTSASTAVGNGEDLFPLPVTWHGNSIMSSGRKDAHKWSAQQTLRLLQMYVSNFERISSDAERNRTIFQEMARVLNEEFATRLTGEQCDSKMRNMKGRYRELKQHNSTPGLETKHWAYLALFDRLFDPYVAWQPLNPEDVEALIDNGDQGSSNDTGVMGGIALCELAPSEEVLLPSGSQRQTSQTTRRKRAMVEQLHSASNNTRKTKRFLREPEFLEEPFSSVAGSSMQCEEFVLEDSVSGSNVSFSNAEEPKNAQESELVKAVRAMHESFQRSHEQRLAQKERMHREKMAIMRQMLEAMQGLAPLP